MLILLFRLRNLIKEPETIDPGKMLLLLMEGEPDMPLVVGAIWENAGGVWTHA